MPSLFDYAPGSESDLSRAVAMRSEITKMLNLCTLQELKVIREALMESPEKANGVTSTD